MSIAMRSERDDILAAQIAAHRAHAIAGVAQLSDAELAVLQAEASVKAAAADGSPAGSISASLPLAARIAANPERTAWGKMWDTDLSALERGPFIDRPWLSRTMAVIDKFCQPGGISRPYLKAVALALARLWYEGQGICHHSWSYIATRAGIKSRDTIRRALAWLRRHGLLLGANVLVRKDGPEGERVANVYLPKLPEEGPPELSLPTPASPAEGVTIIDRIKAELQFIARRCRDAVVTAWGINVMPRAPAVRRRKGHWAPA